MPSAFDDMNAVDDFEPLTGFPGIEPPTLDGDSANGPATLPIGQPTAKRGRANAVHLTFEGETQARSAFDPLYAPPDMGVDYASLPSLEVRPPHDAYEEVVSEREPVTMMHRDPEPLYDYLAPSYPGAAGPQNDQEFFPLRREESGPRERPQPPVPPPARSYAAPIPAYEDAGDSAQWGRDRAQPHGWSSIPPEGASEPQRALDMIPRAPRVPEEMRPKFVAGVQPIRGGTPGAWGTPHARTPGGGEAMLSPAHAIQSSMPAHTQHPQFAPTQLQGPPCVLPPPQRMVTPHPAYAPPLHQGQSAFPGQHHPPPMPMSPAGMAPSSRAMPVGPQLRAPLSGSAKVGRFAWFVAGAAFGITFAFFATGFYSGDGTGAKDAFPPPAPVPTLTAPAATAPAGTTPPVSQATSTTPSPMATTPPAAPAAKSLLTPGATPAPTAGATPAPTAGATPAPTAGATPAPTLGAAPAPTLGAAPAPKAEPPPPPPAKVAPAARPRPQSFRRPPSSQPSAPKTVGEDAPAAPAPPPAPAAPAALAGDISDLLGAALKP